MWIIRKKYAALEFPNAFPNSLVILDKYFSPCNEYLNSLPLLIILDLYTWNYLKNCQIK